MISTSGVELVNSNTDTEVSISERNLISIAHLLASMTCADEKIKDIEKFTAEVFLDEYNPEDVYKIKQIYRDLIKNFDDIEHSVMTINLVAEFTENQKIGLLRSLSAVAVSDGEVHPQEQLIIKSYMKQMGIDQFVNR